jgi:GDP-4-dehydro-6-deoxy-D-mannose reductase
MKCLVTGASGFIGSHLVEFLLDQGHIVYGLSRQTNVFSTNRKGFTSLSCDILDREGVFKLVAEIRPERVFHLAAQSSPRASWADPEKTFSTNVFGTLYLLDAIRTIDTNPVIEVVCSSSEYAPSPTGKPLREDDALEPSSPYALSKITQDQLSALYEQVHKMHIVRVRPFFIIGPRKTGDVTSDLARGIVAIEQGVKSGLKVGNLRAIRDFLGIDDALAAFHLVAESGVSGEVYNVCSGRGYEVGEILQRLLALTEQQVEVQRDDGLMRLLDEPVKIGDNEKIRKLGWNQKQSVDQVLQDVMSYWRNTGDTRTKIGTG